MKTVKRWADRDLFLAQAEKLEVSRELMEAIEVSLAHKDQINYDQVYKIFQESDEGVQNLLLDMGLVIRSA